jgi:UDP-arabinose 4-epimerase
MIKKRILVTGGSGQFGIQVCEALFLAGYEPCIVDRQTETYESIPLFGMIAEMDLLDTDSLTELMQKEIFSAVIHCAHIHDEAESFLKPDLYYENNFGGTLSLLKAMQTTKVSTLLAFDHSLTKESPLLKSYQMCSQLLFDAQKAYGWNITLLPNADINFCINKLNNALK